MGGGDQEMNKRQACLSDPRLLTKIVANAIILTQLLRAFRVRMVVGKVVVGKGVACL